MSGGFYRTSVSGIDVTGAAGPYQGKLISGITVVDVRAARRVSDGLEAMQLVASADSLAGIVKWPSSAGFQIDLSPVDPGSSHSMMQILLQLTEARYRDVFFALCEDVCSVLTTMKGEGEAVRALHSRLGRWQSFLRQNRPDGLSPESQVGLFGELYVLREHLLPRIHPMVVLPAWRGCKGANQDFQFADWALEVKTSRAPILEKVSISNVQQLDEDGVLSLVLTVVQVHSNETTGETLPEMISSLRSRLPDDVRDLLDEGLVEVGYLDVHEELYERTRYQVSDVIHHEVKDGFPRLLREDLPDGVKKVRYEVSLDAAQGFRVNEDSFHMIIEEGGDACGN